eukprot:819454-Pelagomonas_calceolata.AAC.7
MKRHHRARVQTPACCTLHFGVTAGEMPPQLRKQRKAYVACMVVTVQPGARGNNAPPCPECNARLQWRAWSTQCNLELGGTMPPPPPCPECNARH